MKETTHRNLENIRSEDRQLQNQAFQALMEETNSPVDCAYEAWDGLVRDLIHRDNHVRAIAAPLLCNLAKSDPELRMLKDFDSLLAVTKDPRFVTARHCLQSLWKVGAAGKPQRELFLDRLSGRFVECISEKNGTLIRYDIIVGFRQLYEAVKDEVVKLKALELIETKEDLKYHKKYKSVWKR